MGVLDKLRNSRRGAPLPAPKRDDLVEIDKNTFVLAPPDQAAVLDVYKPTFKNIARAGTRKDAKQKSSATILYFTGDGEEMIVFHVRVLRGEILTETWMQAEGGPVKIDKPPTIAERQASAAWLANRGWGKEAQVIEHGKADGDDENSLDISKLSTEELATLLKLKRKATRAQEIDVTPEKGDVE